MRSELIFIVYTRLTKLSQYTAKTQELGKIINLLSSDFNTIEVKSQIFFVSLVTPFTLIGVIVALVFRLGSPGLIIFVVILLFLPLQNFIGKRNGAIIQGINVYKDRRVKLCTEMIEGIKFIKLYGWEIAYERMIKYLRK